MAQSGITSVATLLQIKHPDLPGGLLRIQNYQIGPYNFEGMTFKHLPFDLEAYGAIGRSVGGSNESYRLILPLQNGRTNSRSPFTEYVVNRGLLRANLNIYQVFGANEYQPGISRIQNERLIVSGGYGIWTLSAAINAVSRYVQSIHPNRQFLQY